MTLPVLALADPAVCSEAGRIAAPEMLALADKYPVIDHSRVTAMREVNEILDRALDRAEGTSLGLPEVPEWECVVCSDKDVNCEFCS